MQMYLVALSDDEGEDEDFSFVERAFEGALNLFDRNLWVVRFDFDIRQVAESLGIAEGGSRTGWSAIIVPVNAYFGYMGATLSKRLAALRDA